MWTPKPPEPPKSATNDAVIPAVEATIAGLVQVLDINGQCCAANLLRTVACSPAYVSAIAREARLDAVHGGRAARIDALIASVHVVKEP